MFLQTPFRAQGFAILLLLAVPAASASGQTATNRAFAARAEREFFTAQKQFAAKPGDAAAAWQLGRAIFGRAEFATNGTQRAALAQAGIGACRQALALRAEIGAGTLLSGNEFRPACRRRGAVHRRLQAGQGNRARIQGGGRSWMKLSILPARRAASACFTATRPAGPSALAAGTRRVNCSDRAAALAPDFPENQLNLAESHLRWRQPAEAERALKKLEAIWPSAQTNLVGEAWAKDWDDWTVRRAAARAEFQKAFKHAVGL